MSRQRRGWEELPSELPWVWVTTWPGKPAELGWQGAEVRNTLRCVQLRFWQGGDRRGRVLTYFSILTAITGQFPTGHPAEKQGATLWPEDKSLQDRMVGMLHVGRKQQFLFIKGKLATVLAPIPTVLILCFKVMLTCFLTPNCRRHCKHSFLTRHF